METVIKKITLKSIRLENWASRNCKVVFGKRTKIMGANKVGKSSIMFAWRWLLTSRIDAVHPANYELFDKNVPLSPDTPMAVVEAVVDINGCEYILTRKAEAAFKRERGKSEWIKSPSDKYYTYIDNIEYTATQFGEWLEANIAPLDMLPFCIDGVFFSTLCEDDKKKGRKVLEKIVGEITAMDFKGDYALIAEDLNKLPIEKIIERTKAELSSVRERIEKIPLEIEVKEEMLASLKAMPNLDEEIESTKQKIANLDKQINDGANSEERKGILEEINSKELSLSDSMNTYNAERYAIVSGIRAQISEIKASNKIVADRNVLANTEFERQKRLLDNEKNALINLNNERSALLKRRDEVKARVFTDDICAYCGQPLPIDQLEKAKAKFVEQKTKDLDFIVLQGKNVKSKIEDCEKRISELEVIVAKGVSLESEESTEGLEKELEEVKASFIPYEDTSEYKAITQEIAELKALLPDTINVDKLIQEKQDAMQVLEDLLSKNASKSQCNALQHDIATLREEQRAVGVESALKEGIIAKCNEWIEERASIISNRVNDKLNGCSIQMFTVQKNGEKAPDCVMIDSSGVPYGRTNTGEKMNMDIEMQKLFMRYFGIELPIFIDECSRYNPSNVPTMEQQHVLIFATDDKRLNTTIEE